MLSEKKYIQKLKPYIAGITQSEVERIYNLSKVTKLNANENPWGCSPQAKKKLKKIDFSLYPDGSSYHLVTALSNKYHISHDNLLLGNGSDEILLLLAIGYLRENDEVLISKHTFSQYARVSLTVGAKIRYIPMEKYHHNLEAFQQAITPKTVAIFLCNPNNPTGTYFTEKQLLKLLKNIPRSCVVILDEAYCEFSGNTDFPNSLSLFHKYSNLIIIRTFSKAYGLAALRLGYAISNKKNIQYLQKIRAFNPFNINIVAQIMAVETLKDSKFISKVLTETHKGKQQIEKEFTKNHIHFMKTQGNFICFKTPLESKNLCNLMLSKGILIRSVDHFDLKGWCRVTIGSQTQNQKLLKTLISFLP